MLQNLVLRNFLIQKDGWAYSTEYERMAPVRVEIPNHYWASMALLRQEYRDYRRRYHYR